MSASILERLTNLTKQGQINWRYVHKNPDMLTGVGALENASTPVAFMAEDNELGRILLVLSDPLYESDDPYLIRNGERLEASAADLGLLRDHIKVYMDEILLGQMRPQTALIEEEVEAVYDAADRERQAQMQLVGRLMSQVERSQDLIGQALTVANTIPQMHLPAGPIDESVPLTVESLQTALALIEKNHNGPLLDVPKELLEEIIVAIENFFIGASTIDKPE